jgi:hypothetical protein
MPAGSAERSRTFRRRGCAGAGHSSGHKTRAGNATRARHSLAKSTICASYDEMIHAARPLWTHSLWFSTHEATHINYSIKLLTSSRSLMKARHFTIMGAHLAGPCRLQCFQRTICGHQGDTDHSDLETPMGALSRCAGSPPTQPAKQHRHALIAARQAVMTTVIQPSWRAR